MVIVKEQFMILPSEKVIFIEKNANLSQYVEWKAILKGAVIQKPLQASPTSVVTIVIKITTSRP